MSPIPRYRVMNWWEHGVLEPDDQGRHCDVCSLEMNADAKYICAGDWQRSLEMCTRQPCVCRGES